MEVTGAGAALCDAPGFPSRTRVRFPNNQIFNLPKLLRSGNLTALSKNQNKLGFRTSLSLKYHDHVCDFDVEFAVGNYLETVVGSLFTC